jgi:uncharacterized caspase-like protein
MRAVARLILALTAAFVVFGAGSAHAAKRVALVIGNSAYKFAGTLPNPKNDAGDMTAVLQRLGFQVVSGIDLDKSGFDRKIREFARALQGADVGVFFYAGHGLQVDGKNYLVPTDAELTTASSLDFEMVHLDLVHRTMERETQTNIIFLDACRNNPLERNLRRAMGTRAVGIAQGLAPVESGIGTLISFSTQPGNTAADGNGRNSPFTRALVRHIAGTGDDLSAILISVRNDVMKETERHQVPWEHSALTGRFYFDLAAQATSASKAAQSMVSAEAAEAWRAAERVNNVAALEKFVLRYKDTFYADLARARIDEINRPTPAASASYWTSKPIPAWTGPKVAPPVKTTDKYWVKLCEHVNNPSLANNGANVCMTTHERLDASTGLPVASAAVREIDKRPDRQLLVLVPLGVQQQPGIQVNIMAQDAWAKWHTGQPFDESTVKRITVPISLCIPTGCMGETPVTPELSEMLKSRAGIVLAAVHSSGPAYGVPVPLLGFDETFKGPAMDNRVYGEARKKLMEQLAAQQAAAKEAAAKAAKEKKN